MANSISLSDWKRILKAEGIPFDVDPEVTTNNRNAGRAWGDMHMVLNHHTAGSNSRAVVINGRSGLPGPLAQAYLPKNGRLLLVSTGRANHAGTMARNAYNSFLNESTTHPAPLKASGTLDGNAVAYGIEVENLGDGRDTYPEVQYDTWVRFNAAVCRHYGWSAESCGDHKETSVEGKIDPKGPVAGYGVRGKFTYSGKQLRLDVAERLKHAASWSPSQGATTTPPPAPVPKTVEQRLTALEARVKSLETDA